MRAFINSTSVRLGVKNLCVERNFATFGTPSGGGAHTGPPSDVLSSAWKATPRSSAAHVFAPLRLLCVDKNGTIYGTSNAF